jgi:hypothetical protein
VAVVVAEGDGPAQVLGGGRIRQVSPQKSRSALSSSFPVRCYITKHHVATSVWGQKMGPCIVQI